MLKITRDDVAGEESNVQRWTLCGRLTGPWVPELRSTWERVRGQSNTTYVVDLTDVVSIDDRGERLLRSMQAGGARFVARGVDMRHILTHLRSQARPPFRKALAHLGCDGEGSWDRGQES